MIFPKLRVCMDCGYADFTVPERELSVLVTDAPVNGAIVVNAVGKDRISSQQIVENRRFRPVDTQYRDEHADPDIPILKEAKAEYAKLQQRRGDLSDHALLAREIVN